MYTSTESGILGDAGAMTVGKNQQQLSADFWHILNELRSERVYVNGSILFDIGHKCEGIYLLEEGEVRLTLPAIKGNPAVEMAGAGALLGLSEALSGGTHRLRAEAAGGTQVAFVERSQLLRLLKDHPEFCMQVVKILSENLHALYFKARESAPVRRAETTTHRLSLNTRVGRA